MCTTIAYLTEDLYFGRTLDYERSYDEEVVITPRNCPLPFYTQETMATHYAIIGMASVMDGYPLYYDAVNEKGLGMAGLNFVGSAVYRKEAAGMDNVAHYEFIPWLLGQCASVQEARQLLARINLTDRPFRSDLPAALLHWMVADRDEVIVVEATAAGLQVYDNPARVLTNDPPFPQQMFQLNNYMSLSARQPRNHFAPDLPLHPYSRGMGALGLPGDLSSQSRFVRAAFTLLNSFSGTTEEESVGQFFHIMDTVIQNRGCCEVEPDKYEITVYASCCNASRGIYYYTTYQNRQISAVDLHREDLDRAQLVRYPILREEQIRWQN